ncbi:MAG: hypothetical protein WA324_04160 [Bryobacteraceae bacterium]
MARTRQGADKGYAGQRLPSLPVGQAMLRPARRTMPRGAAGGEQRDEKVNSAHENPPVKEL